MRGKGNRDGSICRLARITKMCSKTRITYKEHGKFSSKEEPDMIAADCWQKAKHRCKEGISGGSKMEIEGISITLPYFMIGLS